jgi:hypothetical protein
MRRPSDNRDPDVGCGASLRGRVAGYRSAAEIARDRFWAARAAGDRRAMTYWSARETVLRRATHGGTPCLSWPGRDLPRQA